MLGPRSDLVKFRLAHRQVSLLANRMPKNGEWFPSQQCSLNKGLPGIFSDSLGQCHTQIQMQSSSILFSKIFLSLFIICKAASSNKMETVQPHQNLPPQHLWETISVSAYIVPCSGEYVHGYWHAFLNRDGCSETKSHPASFFSSASGLFGFFFCLFPLVLSRTGHFSTLDEDRIFHNRAPTSLQKKGVQQMTETDHFGDFVEQEILILFPW